MITHYWVISTSFALRVGLGWGVRDASHWTGFKTWSTNNQAVVQTEPVSRAVYATVWAGHQWTKSLDCFLLGKKKIGDGDVPYRDSQVSSHLQACSLGNYTCHRVYCQSMDTPSQYSNLKTTCCRQHQLQGPMEATEQLNIPCGT